MRPHTARLVASALAVAIGCGMSACSLGMNDVYDHAREDALDAAAGWYDLSLDCLASLSSDARESNPTEADVAGCFDNSVYGLPAADIQRALHSASFLLRIDDSDATWTAHALSVGVGWSDISGRNATVTLSICWSVEVSRATGAVSAAVGEPCGRELLDHTYGRGGEAKFDDVNARRPQ